MRVLVGLVICVASCVAVEEKQVETARQSDESAIHEYAVSHMVAATCQAEKGPPGRPSFPAMQRVHAGAAIVQQPCGLVVAELSTDASLNRFVTAVCPGVAPDECSKRFVQMFLARLGERYPYANWQVITQHCEAYPVDCRQWLTLESWVLESHNATLIRWAQDSYRVRNAQAAAQLEAIHREESQRASAFLAAVANGLSPPQVRCTSTMMGAVVDTTCR